MEKSKRIYIQIPNCLTRLVNTHNSAAISWKYGIPTSWSVAIRE